MPSVINTPRAVLLDWDDHLIDSEGYYDRTSELAFEKMRTDHGYNEPAIPLKERGLQTRTDYFAEQYGPKSVDLFMRLREDILMDHKQPAPILRPGATELLRFLELNHIPYAIASDTPQARLENNVLRTLEASGLTIPAMVGTSATIPHKPAPDMALEALKKLSEKTGEIITIACFGALLITLITVSFQAIKAATSNPVKSLRTE